jgi:hypothetical protein
VFNAVEQTKFLDVSEDADRLKQSIAGLILGQIAQTAIELELGNYVSYNDKVVAKADVPARSRSCSQLAKVELAKDARLTDAVKRLNALEKQETGVLAKAAFDAAAKRGEKVDAPVAIIARISNFAAADEKAVVDAFKAVLGPETKFFATSKADAKNAGKKQIDVAMGVDQSEIGTQDTEFSIQCIKSQVDCEILEDVHKATFDFAQKKPAMKNNNDNNNGGYGDDVTNHNQNQNLNSASSLIVAAGAVLASIASLL